MRAYVTPTLPRTLLIGAPCIRGGVKPFWGELTHLAMLGEFSRLAMLGEFSRLAMLGEFRVFH